MTCETGESVSLAVEENLKWWWWWW